jgi:hypothetical protein
MSLMTTAAASRSGFRVGRGWTSRNLKMAVCGLALGLLWGGCATGHRSTRTDSAALAPKALTSQQDQRAEAIRRTYPHLSEAQVAERVRHEFPDVTSASRREMERRAAQRTFEDEMAAGRRMYDQAEHNR